MTEPTIPALEVSSSFVPLETLEGHTGDYKEITQRLDAAQAKLDQLRKEIGMPPRS